MTGQAASDTTTSIYDGIVFQNKVGTLTLNDEKILFTQDADSCAAPRSWMWTSMKKYQAVISASDDGNVKRVIKISNHANKAVSFHVPEEDAFLPLQEDIGRRLHASSCADGEAVAPFAAVKEPMVSAEKAQNMMSKVDAIKKANQARRQKPLTKSDVLESIDTPVAPSKQQQQAPKKKKPASRSKSFDEGLPAKPTKKKLQRSKSDDAAPPVKPKIVQRTKSDSDSKGSPEQKKKKKILRSKSGTDARGDDAESPSGAQRSSGSKVTLTRAAKVIAQDLFVKPTKQIAHDYVVRPTNNLVVKPTKNKIVKPATEKIVKPTQQAAQKIVVKPATEKIVKPTQQAAQTILQPTMVIAKDMGLIKQRSSSVTAAAEGDGNNNNSSSDLRASGKQARKHSFLHFLKTPQRRNFSDSFSTDASSEEITPEQQQTTNNVVATSA